MRSRVLYGALLASALGLTPGLAGASPAAAPPLAQEPASSRNYQATHGRSIDMIVIHKAEGPASSVWNTFKSPRAKVSAHYVVDDSGNATQMVPDQDIAWHCGNPGYNHRSIGIENAGYTDQNDISDQHLRGLARLTRYLCDKYGIPRDRQHIIGHDEVPDPDHKGRFGGRNNHQDPGHYFDWPLFMKYVNGDATVADASSADTQEGIPAPTTAPTADSARRPTGLGLLAPSPDASGIPADQDGDSDRGDGHDGDETAGSGVARSPLAALREIADEVIKAVEKFLAGALPSAGPGPSAPPAGTPAPGSRPEKGIADELSKLSGG